jgi:membrane protein implicated in regulation of membrane protease activity
VKRILIALGFLLLAAPALLAEEQINVFPSSAFDRLTIYINLALFWIALVVLIVLIRLKLREIERTQEMDVTPKDEKIPMLE